MEVQKRLMLVVTLSLVLASSTILVIRNPGENMDEGTLTKTKEILDDMHKRQIDMADGIYVINVGGYIGDSTRSKIAYTKKHGKEEEYLEPME